MSDATATQLASTVRQFAYRLETINDYDPLMDWVGEARLVLIGEASHGTHEFYEQRAEITKRLIRGKGFTAVAVEADWPDAYRVNRFVRGVNDDATADEALQGFQQFPSWMWRNTDVLNFVTWLRQHNDTLPLHSSKIGFYRLDLYSMYASMGEVLTYLERVDPDAAQQARHRYSCFEHCADDSQAYGYTTSFDIDRSYEDAAVNQLIELQRKPLENDD